MQILIPTKVTVARLRNLARDAYVMADYFRNDRPNRLNLELETRRVFCAHCHGWPTS
jgi:hypothetical protein